MAKRYSLPAGKAVRFFGVGDVYTNENITDERVEALIKVNPDARKVFIDSRNVEPTPSNVVAQDGTDLTSLTKKELHAKYAELTGGVADSQLNKDALLALVKAELDAKTFLG